jgi:hypothetical protein
MTVLLSLEIAGITIEICSTNLLALSHISPVYQQFIAGPDHPPSDSVVKIALEIGSLPDAGMAEKIFDADQSWSIFFDGNGYLLELKPPPLQEPLWVARFDLRFKNTTIYCGRPSVSKENDRLVVMNPFSYPLDQIMLMYILSQEQGALLHAAGMRMQNRACIFPGRSGAGKSTFSRLLLGQDLAKMLSDDRIIVRKIDNVFRAFGTPWPGDAGIAENKSAQLEGIFFIYHGSENRIGELSPQEALRSLLPVVSIPWYDEKPLSDILALCEDLVNSVPAHALHFRPDRSAADFFEKFLAASSR